LEGVVTEIGNGEVRALITVRSELYQLKKKKEEEERKKERE
jgi:hypothetical protein